MNIKIIIVFSVCVCVYVCTYVHMMEFDIILISSMSVRFSPLSSSQHASFVRQILLYTQCIYENCECNSVLAFIYNGRYVSSFSLHLVFEHSRFSIAFFPSPLLCSLFFSIKGSIAFLHPSISFFIICCYDPLPKYKQRPAMTPYNLPEHIPQSTEQRKKNEAKIDNIFLSNITIHELSKIKKERNRHNIHHVVLCMHPILYLLISRGHEPSASNKTKIG